MQQFTVYPEHLFPFQNYNPALGLLPTDTDDFKAAYIKMLLRQFHLYHREARLCAVAPFAPVGLGDTLCVSHVSGAWFRRLSSILYNDDINSDTAIINLAQTTLCLLILGHKRPLLAQLGLPRLPDELWNMVLYEFLTESTLISMMDKDNVLDALCDPPAVLLDASLVAAPRPIRLHRPILHVPYHQLYLQLTPRQVADACFSGDHHHHHHDDQHQENVLLTFNLQKPLLQFTLSCAQYHVCRVCLSLIK